MGNTYTSLFAIEEVPENKHQLPIEVWQRILSLCYDKETMVGNVLDDSRYRLRINCYNDRLQLQTLRSLSCLNSVYCHMTRMIWGSIEYLPYSMRATPNTMSRLNNIRFLDLTTRKDGSLIGREYLSNLTQLTGLKLISPKYSPFDTCLNGLMSSIEELDLKEGCSLSKISINTLRQLKRLRCIVTFEDENTMLSLTNLTDLDMHTHIKIPNGEVFQSLTKLKKLRWEKIREGIGHDFDHLTYLTGLRDLSLVDGKSVPGDVLEKFCHLKSLSLSDVYCICDDNLTSLVSLTSLSLHKCYNIEGTCFNFLPSFTRLELICDHMQDVRWWAHFRNTTNLKILSIQDRIIEHDNDTESPHGFRNTYHKMYDTENFKQLTNLTCLNLPVWCRLDNDYMPRLTDLPKLIIFNNELIPPRRTHDLFSIINNFY
jgi:hypothetical protein